MAESCTNLKTLFSGLRKINIYISKNSRVFGACLCISYFLIGFQLNTECLYAQTDSVWTQVLGGWLDGVYNPTLFLGGIGYARIALADIDGDGDKDLFYGGGNGGCVTFFENTGTPEQFHFEFRQEAWSAIPFNGTTGNWCLEFADLDNDGDLDLFWNTQLDGGSVLKWNGGGPNDFWLIPDSTSDIGGMGSPILVDIDNDGDYDYFSGYGDWNTELIYYRNDGTSEVPHFVLVSQRYQNLDLGSIYHCDMSDIDLDGDIDLLVGASYGRMMLYLNDHIGPDPHFMLADSNYLASRYQPSYRDQPRFADMDNDGDEDLFLSGDDGKLSFFENMGLGQNPQFAERFDTTYFVNFKVGSVMKNSVDIDGDGDPDLAPGTTFLRNDGPFWSPHWTTNDDFFPYVKGSFCDIDNDGDYDLFIAGGAFTVGWFQNIGTRFSPIWGEFTELFPPDGRLYNIFNVTTADIDADGDYDLFIGHTGYPGDRGINFYRNVGTPEHFQFVFETDLYAGFQRNMGFDQDFGDIDNDGDLDLIIADVHLEPSRNKLHLYRNIGSPQNAQWEHVTDDFQQIFSHHRFGYGFPSFIDYDGDGDLDLAIGASNGMQLYLNPLIMDTTNINNEGSVEGSADLILKTDEYPNPTNGTVQLIVDMGTNGNLVISVYNILGEKVKTIENSYFTKGHIERGILTKELSSGIYFIRYSFNETTVVKKIAIVK